MIKLKLNIFGGLQPKKGIEDLPDEYAQISSNVKYYSGDLIPYRGSSLIENISPLTKTIYPFSNSDGSLDWIAFDEYCDIVPSPISDTNQRIYITGLDKPKVTDKDIYPTLYDLGIPKPINTINATLGGGGTGLPQPRSYIYTFVTEWGEEGEPSDSSNIVNAKEGQTVFLTGFDSANIPNRNITAMRIYRTVLSATGVASFNFIDEVPYPLGQPNFVDTSTTADLGETLSTVNYDAPTDDLNGLISIPGGIFVGFSGRDIYFSQPYLPYAWPRNFSQAVEYDIVGLSPVGGNSFVILTTSYPYLCTGTQPESMRLQKLETAFPCLSKESIVDVGYGAVYASYNGLVLANGNGVKLITQDIHVKDSWEEYSPESMVGVFYDNKYIASYTGGTIIFDFVFSDFISDIDFQFTSAKFVEEERSLYYSAGDNIYLFDADSKNSLTQKWRSKRFRLPYFVNIGAFRVLADYATDMASEDNPDVVYNRSLGSDIGGALNDDELNYLEMNGSYMRDIRFENFLIFRFYSDGELVYSKYIDSSRIFRLPAGYKSDNFEIEIECNIRVREIHIAETPEELKEV